MASAHNLLRVACTVLLCSSLVWTQNLPTVFPNCCGEKLMDSGRHIVVEPRRLLELASSTPREYRGAMVRLCSGDPFYLQLWELVDEQNTIFNLTWQQYYGGGGYNPVIAFDTPAFVDHESRFGMYSEGSVSLKFPIPYDINTDGPNNDRILYRTPFPLSDDDLSRLTVNSEWQLDNLPWPRMFSNNIELCVRSDCTDLDTLNPDIPDGGAGVPGPPGPPGPPGQCQSTCDLSAEALDILVGTLPDDVEEIKDDTTVLKDDVQQMKELLNNLMNSQSLSVTCPTGFSTGGLGIDGCYVVVRQKTPLAVAHMQCRTEYQGSILASIPNQVTEDFLKTLVVNTYGGGSTADTEESFWIRGIWSTSDNAWVWYDENSKAKQLMSTHTNWDVDEQTDTGVNRCLSFNVMYGPSTSIWHSEDCHSYRPFICEIPKTCL